MRTQGRVAKGTRGLRTLLACLSCTLVASLTWAEDGPAIERIQGTKKLSPWESVAAKPAATPTHEQAHAVAELIEKMPVELRNSASATPAAPLDPLPDNIDSEEAQRAAASTPVLPPQEVTTVKQGALTVQTVATPTGGSSSVSLELSGPQLAVLAVALLLGPIVAFISIFTILRKCGVPFFPFLRVEVAQPRQDPSHWDDGRFQVESFRMTTDHADEALGDGTAHHFDVGPSYEEERMSKEASLRQQEQAVLQYVFQQNVQLREQIAAEDA